MPSHSIALILPVDPRDKGQVDAKALMGTEKGLPFQLGKQPGQFTVKLDGIAVFAVQKYMVTQLLQIEKVGERDTLFHSTLPDSQLWHAVFLQLYKPQEVIYLLLLDGVF